MSLKSTCFIRLEYALSLNVLITLVDNYDNFNTMKLIFPMQLYTQQIAEHECSPWPMGSAVCDPRLSFLHHSCVTVALLCWENYLKCEKGSSLKSRKIQKKDEWKKCRCWDSANQQIRHSVWKIMTWKGNQILRKI